MADAGLNRVVRHLLQAARGRGGGNLTDCQLLEYFLAGRDERAFEALVYRHGPMVLGLCRRVLGHVQDAEDAFQATFLVLFKKGASIRPRSKVGNWLYGVAYRIALKARASRCKRRAKEKPLSEAHENQAAPIQPSLDWLPLFDRELHGLPDKYRAPILLCDLQRRTQHDAARQLGWPEGTLSGRLSRARVLLAKRLTRRGFTMSSVGLATALSAQGAFARVPWALAESTVKAVQFIAINQAVTVGVISAQTAALTQGVLQTMLWTKIKTAVIGILAVTLVTTGLGRALYPVAGQSQKEGAGGVGIAPKVVSVEGPSKKAKDLETKLRTAGNFEFRDLSLGEVLDDLRKKQGINIFVDPETVIPNEAQEVKISLQFKDVPLETALRYLAKSAKLGLVNQDGILVLTLPHNAMVRKIYPVDKLLGQDGEKNVNALIQAIVYSVEPGTWFFKLGTQNNNAMQQNIVNPFAVLPQGPGQGPGNAANWMQQGIGAGPPPIPVSDGGPAEIELAGTISYFPGTKSLVVRHYVEVQREIEELLKNLAESKPRVEGQ